MGITVDRKQNRFYPDTKRVIARFYLPGGSERTKNIISKILRLSANERHTILNQTLMNFSGRHRNISRIFEKHFNYVKPLIVEIGKKPELFDKKMQLLIGSYFTKEYSIESAAFFNPSMVEDSDQSNLSEGEKRVIVSFRATGEGHISSLVFRRGIIGNDGNLTFDPEGYLLDEAEVGKNFLYKKSNFVSKLREMNAEKNIIVKIFDLLDEEFNYSQLEKSIEQFRSQEEISISTNNVLNAMLWPVSAHYEITFSLDTPISNRVIFPIAECERNGIEDARFVRFKDDDGSHIYFATYTAYDGYTILPQLITTKNFYHFKVRPLLGKYAQNKGMALFPRKINGKYAMVSRIDGENNYIMYSKIIDVWEHEPIKFQEPENSWEFVQIGNSGSPIETEKGWLLITHGVGPMREYCLGASLLDLDNPTIIIGILKEPLLRPNREEREGYVPNVVYSCGSIIHNGKLIIPYAMSDYSSAIASVDLDILLKELSGNKVNLINESLKHDRKRILVVDDNKMIRLSLSDILGRNNYDVTVCSDGAEALMVIASEKFDIILSDIHMPRFNGFQLLNFLKDKQIDIPVGFISTSTDAETEIKGLRQGAVEYFKKPISEKVLLSGVEKMLK